MKIVNPKTDGYIADKVLDAEAEDQMAIRGITAEDGRRFVVRQKESSSLWQVQPRRGPVPQALSGLYTTIRDAEQAIVRYCNHNPVR